MRSQRAARPAHSAARERQQLARRLLREASLELARLRRTRGAYRKTWRRVSRARARLAFAAALLAAPLAEPALAGTPIFEGQFLLGPSSVSYGATPAFADIDGDGDLDALVGDSYGNTIFFANTGSANAPAFAAPSTNPFGLSNFGGPSPTFADIDGDGDLDAFSSLSFCYFACDHFTLFSRNTGTASAPAFAAASTNSFGLTGVGFVQSLAFADLDGDGDLDAFFVGSGAGNTIFFANTGTASAPAFAAPSSNPFGLANVGSDASPLACADLDGDGDLDVFVGNGDGYTIFFANTGTASTPAFAAPSTNPFGLADVGDFASPAFADLDGDGDLDAFVGEYYGKTIVFENTGTASAPAFAAPSANPFGLANVGSDASPAFADLDGDGDLDALVGEHYGNTIFFANTGTASAPAFAAPSTNPFGLADVGHFASPAFADLDGDGDLDAFVGEYFGNTFFFENVELGPGTCADGLDNDFDGRTDSPSDPGCADAADPNERSSKQCDNGVDDDGDTQVDWRGDGSGDPDCVSLTDNNEATPLPSPSSGCGIGPELLLLAPALSTLRRRRRDRRSP